MPFYFSDLEKTLYATDLEIDAIRGLCMEIETGRFLGVQCKNNCYTLEQCTLRGNRLEMNEKSSGELHKCSGKQLLGMAVMTEGKERLGVVRDFAFEPNLFSLTHIVLDKMFMGIHWGKRIIPRQQILEIRARTIIIRQNEVPKKNSLKRPVVEISPA